MTGPAIAFTGSGCAGPIKWAARYRTKPAPPFFDHFLAKNDCRSPTVGRIFVHRLVQYMALTMSSNLEWFLGKAA